MSLETEEILSTVRALVDLAPRATGSPGGLASAAYVAERFHQAGLPDVRVMEAPSFSWRAEQCRLHIDGAEIAAGPILHSAVADHEKTGTLVDAPVGAPVVDIGSGRVKDFAVRGRIVLFDLAFEMTLKSMLPLSEYRYDPDRMLRRRDVLAARNPYVTSLTRVMTEAAAAGAVGVIGVLRDYPESIRYHNEYYRLTALALPGVWITRDTGTALRQRLRSDSAAEIDMVVVREAVTSQTVIGVLPGLSREAIMVQSHHDSIGPGAVEDATGTAEVIALAEYFAGRAKAGERREKTLLFTLFDTHFTGYQAHQEFCTQYILAKNPEFDIVLNTTIEHVGLRAVRGTDGAFEGTGETEPRGIFENLSVPWKRRLARSVKRHRLHGTTILNSSFFEFRGIPTDASFVLVAGVPIVSLISGPLYLYDDADTEEYVDIDQLAPVARFFADIIDQADRTRGSTIGFIPAALRRRLPRGRW